MATKSKPKLALPPDLLAIKVAAHDAVCSLHTLKTRREFECALLTTWRAYCAFRGPVMLPTGSAEREWDLHQHHVECNLVQAACSLAHFIYESDRTLSTGEA